LSYSSESLNNKNKIYNNDVVDKLLYFRVNEQLGPSQIYLLVLFSGTVSSQRWFYPFLYSHTWSKIVIPPGH
jgi:hypothetical protein